VGCYAREPRAAKAAQAPKAAAGPGKIAAIREAAERGELPPVPDFSADLHKRNRGRLAQLVAMAEAGDVAGLEAFPIKPNCTSPKAMDHYRNLCVIALNVRAAKPAAGVGLRSKSA
jgi:phage gp29-like protein